jgi:uncharacterized protein
VAVLDALDAAAVRRWCSAALDALTAREEEINDLNVYPVPDGDTGTNLVLTLRSADQALRPDGGPGAPDVGPALAAMARGAVLGARGNSGVIISQILRGLAEVAAEAGTADRSGQLDGRVLQAALQRSTELAYQAVAEPVEGTVLSVARAATEAGCAAEPTLPAVTAAAARGGSEALARTPDQLDVLARAGVVDAGGQGLVVLLEALAVVVSGVPPSVRPRRRTPRDPRHLQTARETGSSEYSYEVQYLLAADDAALPALRTDLAALGDSLVVVGTGDGLWNVHVHVNDVGAALEVGVEAGRPRRITVTRFADTIGTPGVDASGTAAGTASAPVREGVAVVAVAPGEGVADLFTAEGVVVVEGGPTSNPSTAEVLAAIRDTAAANVVVLPNSPNVTAVAGAAAEQARAEGIEVAVVPTGSAVQGLAAVAVHDESRWFGDDVVAMAEAAAATRHAEVTVAVRDALTMAGPCRAGDVLGLAEGDVVLIGQSVPEVGCELLDRMLLTGGELVTVVVGADADDGLGRLLERHVAATHPEVEVTVYTGGQPHYPLLMGVE